MIKACVSHLLKIPARGRCFRRWPAFVVAFTIISAAHVGRAAEHEFKATPPTKPAPQPERSGVTLGCTLDFPYDMTLRLGYALDQRWIVAALITVDWEQKIRADDVEQVGNAVYLAVVQYWPVDPLWLRVGGGVLDRYEPSQTRLAGTAALGVDVLAWHHNALSAGLALYVMDRDGFRRDWRLELGWAYY